MKEYIVLVFLLSILTSCAASPEAIQTAVDKTQAKWTLVPTQTAYPTYTPIATYTPYPTQTRYPTYTPYPTPKKPTNTPAPTITPTPSFLEQVNQIGPIWDSLYDSKYSIEITVKNIEWLKGEQFSEPKKGKVFLIVHIEVVNLGPGSVRSFGLSDFQVLDSNGILSDHEYFSSAENCALDYVDLLPNATLEGCIPFEVPEVGKLEFIYAPFQYEGLKPGRYLSFIIRE